ncbi:phosphatidylinositol mannoside acyltransferase [Actinomyces bowdenii]|nr:phosphatidylinositol mannoside acyltransferase [Actinomyces bowdenii]
MPVEALYRLAWRGVRHLPSSAGYALFHAGADLAWALHRLRPESGRAGGVGQLERNLARLLPGGASQRALRRLGRAGMRSYMRYFYEAFALPGISQEQIRARVRADLDPRVRQDLQRSSIVLALPHMGNWDLVGAWACRELAPVLTVAERLEPPDLFEQFTAFRQGLGMRVLGQARGERVFERLVEAAGEGRYAIALLADRDLSSSGVRTGIGGHPAYVAAGPAAIAQRLALPLYAAAIHYERLTGERRRRAGGAWGLVLTVRRVPVPWTPGGSPRAPGSAGTGGDGGHERIARATRAWVRALEPLLIEHAVDWHMLQPVFEADLDPERLARGRARDAGRAAV